MVRDMRQGREMFNRSPLEYEDEIAIIEYFKEQGWVDHEKIGVIGMSHGGEMALKIVSEYDGLAAAVASEPASRRTPHGRAAPGPAAPRRDVAGASNPGIVARTDGRSTRRP